MELVYLIATGFFAGIVGSLLGLGGGIILVPALTLIFGLPMTEAVGTSLMGVVAVSTAAAIDFLKSGRADLELGLTLETLTALGALSGGLLAAVIATRSLYILFGIVLLYAAFNMIRSRNRLIENEKAIYPKNKEIGLGLSFAAGNVSGLLGIGGGVMKVPLLNLVMGVPLKIATATSSYMIGITAATASIIYLVRGDVDFYKAAPIILGIFFGSRLGASFSYRIDAFTLRLLFVAILLYTAYKMISTGF
ncbi:MAG: sulfite exporter TauE/SafE family protein [candidate division Zixibacteria bacterium]